MWCIYEHALVEVMLRKFGYAVIRFESGRIDMVREDELKECN